MMISKVRATFPFDRDRHFLIYCYSEIKIKRALHCQVNQDDECFFYVYDMYQS